ncbi:hypothetical protein Pmani_006347 [Petrolisthes manimaculis]|uniref:Uncharacterized protein n=1 Tax=Petrolisthes manimaculis TaxID=1843537 RepID=A0AAE1QAJ9_9EUCA|nr:hypothetical protein Pmani_006347 [Petrolisthes manimaculis]
MLTKGMRGVKKEPNIFIVCEERGRPLGRRRDGERVNSAPGGDNGRTTTNTTITTITTTINTTITTTTVNTIKIKTRRTNNHTLVPATKISDKQAMCTGGLGREEEGVGKQKEKGE